MSVTFTPVAFTGPLLWAVIVNVTLLFRFGVALSTVFVMAMSAACPVTITDALLLPATGSGCVSADLLAVFVSAEVLVSVATMVSVALPPLARAPMVQVPATYVVPTLGAADTKVRPAGNTSVTTTPVAALGPLLVAVTVKTTLVPKSGGTFETVLVVAMSADCPVTVAEAELLPATGSTWSSALFVAVFVSGDVLLSVATMVSVALTPLASAPMVQTPATYDVPALGVAGTRARPTGSTSVTTTPVALLGPLLVAVMVKVTLEPRFGVAFVTVLVMAMSADCPVTVTEA